MSITGRFWVSTEAQVARATSQIGSGPALLTRDFTVAAAAP